MQIYKNSELFTNFQAPPYVYISITFLADVTESTVHVSVLFTQVSAIQDLKAPFDTTLK